MIVECSNCDTRFQLDDARVPLRGIRVRCSRCKEAFFLEHPDATTGDKLNDVAEQAAVGAPPDSTQDLQPNVAPSAPGPSAEPDEEDWEFSEALPGGDPNEMSGHDFAAPEDDPFHAGEVDVDPDSIGEASDADEEPEGIPGLGVDELSQEDEDDLVSGLDLAGADDFSAVQDDLAGGSEGISETPEGLVGADESDPESAFGDMSDFSALADEATTDDDVVIETPSAPPAAPAAAAVAAPAEAPADVGEPEDWDFFSDDSSDGPAVTAADSAMGRVTDAVDDPSRLRAPARDPDLGSVGESGPRFTGLRSLGRSIGWIATCCLLGLGIARGALDGRTAAARPITSVDFGVLEAQQVRGSWFETARSTQLYAVTGHLVNSSQEPRMPGTGLRVTLTSPSGAELEVPAARTGLPLSESQLRELGSDDLASAHGAAVSELSTVRLEPGQAVAFQAFFDGIPDEATGFVLEMEGTPPALPARLPDAMDPGLFETETELPTDVPEDGAQVQTGAEDAAARIPSSAGPALAPPQPAPR